MLAPGGRYAAGEGAQHRLRPNHLEMGPAALADPDPRQAKLAAPVHTLFEGARWLSPREMPWLLIRSHPDHSAVFGLGEVMVVIASPRR